MHIDLVGEPLHTLQPQGHPFMSGPFTPNWQEVNASGLEVIGEIPRRLNGA